MLAFISQWFQTLILVMILASLVEMLLPSRSMERYVRLVLSLTVLMAVLTPVFNLLNSQWLEKIQFWDWYQDDGTVGAEGKTVAQVSDQFLKLRDRQTLQLTEQELEKAVIREVEARFSVAVEDVHVTLGSSRGTSEEVGVQAMELSVRPSDQVQQVHAAPIEPGDDTDAVHGQHRTGLNIQVQPVDIQVQPVDIRLFPTYAATEPSVPSWTEETVLVRQVRAWLAGVYQLDEANVIVRISDGR